MINGVTLRPYNIRFAILFWLLIAIRMFFSGVLPLMDKTEARYAEISRIMAETNDWIVLQIDYSEPGQSEQKHH